MQINIEIKRCAQDNVKFSYKQYILLLPNEICRKGEA